MTISVHLFLLFLTSEFWGKQNSYALSYNAVSNWKSSSQLYYPGILSTWFMCCLEEECMHIFQSILLWITYFHCPLFFQQWTWNMPFSCNLDSYSRQNVNMRTAPKTKVKVRNCTRSSDYPVTGCLYIAGMETSPGIHVLTQPKHMVKE